MIVLLLLALGVIAHAVDSNGEEGWRDVYLDVEIYRTFIARENLNFVEEHNKNPDAGFRMHPYREFLALSRDEVRAKYFMDPKIAESPLVFSAGKIIKISDSKIFKTINNYTTSF
jgi:hypothetical protein